VEEYGRVSFNIIEENVMISYETRSIVKVEFLLEEYNMKEYVFWPR
jgi:hypothetical protein